ncbi:hypothetical protein TWF730_004862 [Orbilia blumenaviensis]|uniref:Metalloendopeptidase n=1 Tax=Orbilia blumenaviensis TaxID=1796055 RepID=A0AAV9VMQ4_9PEZI
MDKAPQTNISSVSIPPSASSPQFQGLPATRKLYSSHPSRSYDCDGGGSHDGSDDVIAPSKPPAPQRPLLSIDTSRDRQCTSSPNTGIPFVPGLLQPSSHQLTRASSFRTPNCPRSSFESDRFGYLLGRSSSSSGQGCLPSNSSMVSLRAFSCTPTTENLARRMAYSSASNYTANLPMPPLDTEPYFHPILAFQRPAFSGDGPSEDQHSLYIDSAQNSLTEMTSNTNASTHSLSTTREDGTATIVDLVSYLPKIPAASTKVSEEERVAKWGPNVGPPTGGTTYRNPYNYELLEAYCEQEDHPMFNVAESTRRAGNAAIQTMFDPLYALPGLDGQVPRGFPLYGFSMREMPTAILHEVLHAYGIEPIDGIGYDVDRQNMSLLCGHIGATWLSGVI